MSIFGKLFNKKKKVEQKRGFHKLKVKELKRLTPDAVQVIFDIPEDLKTKYKYVPGQYLNVSVELSDNEIIRSYSICSSINEDLSIAVKEVEGGLVSNFINDDLQEGDSILVSEPMGNFKLLDAGKKYVAIAAGSGITPIASIVKTINLSQQGQIDLFYCNKSEKDTMFKDDLDDLSNDKVKIHYSYTRDEVDGAGHGRLTENKISELIKQDLDLLKSDGFYLCGPEQMIYDALNALKTFGVPENKINFELFTTPEIIKTETVETSESFEGTSQVVVVLDDEETEFELPTDGDTILDEVLSQGIDAPYSCRGGVCSTCRAKILEGSAKMDSNMGLTDSEVEDGYILTCQSHPTSSKIKVTYDD